MVLPVPAATVSLFAVESIAPELFWITSTALVPADCTARPLPLWVMVPLLIKVAGEANVPKDMVSPAVLPATLSVMPESTVQVVPAMV